MIETPNDFRNIVAFKDDDAVRKALGRAADELGLANTENQRLIRRVADIASFQSATQRNENKRLTTEGLLKDDVIEAAIGVFHSPDIPDTVDMGKLRVALEALESTPEIFEGTTDALDQLTSVSGSQDNNSAPDEKGPK